MLKMILRCTCKHEYQDKLYGKGMRVHNYAPKGYQGKAGYRCTVCKVTRQANETQKLDEVNP
jgi:hypothetical protein